MVVVAEALELPVVEVHTQLKRDAQECLRVMGELLAV
jgi:hypothetical protein